MKKLTLILSSVLILILTVSCDKDEQDTSATGLTIGEWQLVGYELKGIDSFTDCLSNSTLTINEDGTFSRVTYLGEEDVCEIDENETGTGSYTFIENVEFDLLYEGEDTARNVQLIVTSSDFNQLKYYFQSSGDSVNYIYERIE